MGTRSFDAHAIGSRATSRRRLVGIGAGLAAGYVLGGRAALAQDATPGATPADGWFFTDDKGVTVELDAFPERLAVDVNAAAALWDFGIRPGAVFGWNATDTGDFGPAGGNVDPSQVEVVGVTAEPIQLEKLIAFDPDLTITISWTPDNPDDYWSIDPEILPQVREIAPLLALSATGSADVNTERFAELAAALGADLDTPELAEARARYEQAIADLEATAAEQSDLQVLFLYVDDVELYIANPPDWADLNFYVAKGVNAIVPDAEPLSFWEQLSLEQALKYPSDVIMISSRPGAKSPEDLASHPTFSAHPAVQAGQAFAWNQDFIQSYQGMADAIEHLVEVLAGSEKVI
jgi:iron complex transport system substrate-binding protein